ncbi:hypothetical protein BDQ12DRAFT_676626, partial [Crucibulum laeve]
MLCSVCPSLGLFIICNAIIASIAVWNLSILQSSGLSLSSTGIDSFLVFVGTSGLCLIFVIIFLELSDKDIFIGRVWFECAWVGLYGAMQLAGAVALTSVAHHQSCNPTIFSPTGSSCESTQILLAFTWISGLFLMSYLLLLVVASVIKSKKDPTIWHCNVRRFPWVRVRHSVPSGPSSPALPRFQSPPPIIAPKPQRAPALPEAIYSYRSGLSSEYEVEHYQPYGMINSGPITDTSFPPVLAPLRHPSQSRAAYSTAFYPQLVQNAISSQPSPSYVPQQNPMPPSPPPLGDWPRLDATSRPSRTKQRQLSNGPQAPTPADVPNPIPPQGPPPSSPAGASRPRPGGPRRRSNSGENSRPPQLDLSNISSFHTRGY